MPFWSLALPFGLLAALDYRAATADSDRFRARLRRWRARGAVLCAASGLLVYLPGLAAAFMIPLGWRDFGPSDAGLLQYGVLTASLGIGLSIMLVAWMGLRAYRRYPGLVPTTPPHRGESGEAGA